MANTGIIYRRNLKKYFENPENQPLEGEVVFATDTNEYGAISRNSDGNTELKWRPHLGIVESVCGKTGNVELTKIDIGLGNVDNTRDIDKPISDATRNEFETHYSKVNPHNITPEQIGLGQVNNTSDLDKPISTLTQMALDLKLDKSAIPADAKFTDTTYEIKDGELSEFNFSKMYKDKLDYLSTNRQLLSIGPALSVDGRTITLTRADGSQDSIETQDTIFNDSSILKQIGGIIEKLEFLRIVDDLNGWYNNEINKGVLSANQGKVLDQKINEIKETLKSDNINLDTLKEIVSFIENNRNLIDSLSIDNISGLREALNRKLDWSGSNNTAFNATYFDNHSIDEFAFKTELNSEIEKVKTIINSIDFNLYATKEYAENYTNLKIGEIDYSAIYDRINSVNQDLLNRINNIDLAGISRDLQDSIIKSKEEMQRIQQEMQTKFSEMLEKIQNLDINTIRQNITSLEQIVQSNNLATMKNTIENIRNDITTLGNAVGLRLLENDVKKLITNHFNETILSYLTNNYTNIQAFNNLVQNFGQLESQINSHISSSNTKFTLLEQFKDVEFVNFKRSILGFIQNNDNRIKNNDSRIQQMQNSIGELNREIYDTIKIDIKNHSAIINDILNRLENLGSGNSGNGNSGGSGQAGNGTNIGRGGSLIKDFAFN